MELTNKQKKCPVCLMNSFSRYSRPKRCFNCGEYMKYMTLEFHPESKTDGLKDGESYFVISYGSPAIAFWSEENGWFSDCPPFDETSIEWWAEIPTDYKKW